VTGRFDLAVIGGGINGCGIARDAAGRGLSVLLVEQGDLAGATSSASTKLIHGGLRYLEHYAFRLVREALAEREVLLRAAPHLVRPMRFVLPHHRGLRPWWMIRAGLFLYDHLGKRELLPGCAAVDLRHDPVGQALKPDFTQGFEYSDCWVDDARMVVANARDAANRGADIRVRTRCESARRAEDQWLLRLSDGTEVSARALVNATGPWVASFLNGAVQQNVPDAIRLVKGSHLVVRQQFAHDRSYIFQNSDGRICFAIPYEHDFTLIGTTDEDYTGDPADVRISDAEQTYLLQAVNGWLRKPVSEADIVWRYSGVRPLHDDGSGKAQDATRDYVLEIDGTPPLLNVFGGKLTTYRRLAEAALQHLSPFFPGLSQPWTATSQLPGGNFAWNGADELADDLRRRYPFLSAATAARMTRAYGTEAHDVLGDAQSEADLGACFGADLTAREVDWMAGAEWARTADDVLWRRSKLGLRLTAAGAEALARHLARR
jgi:glycerol-3-phosphate dehydrogenase